ncbi:hypothetical protein MRX96_014098 [Rhipicephalus microplus]
MTARIVDGVLQSPFTLDDYEGISAPQLIRDRLQKYADKVIAIDVDAHLTGAELLHRIRRSAAGIFPRGFMAKTAFVERELRYEIEDSKCEWILTDEG